MDTKSEDIAKSSEAAASCVLKDNASQSDSNLKSGKDSDCSEKLSQALDPIEDSEEDLLLCMTSDSEAFEDSCDVKENAKKKCAVGERTEKYFSDIESSDNSQEYEPKLLENDVVVVEKGAIDSKKEKIKLDEVESAEKHKESDKIIELDLEPVESDEEEFDENPSLKKTEETKSNKDDSTEKETDPVEVIEEQVSDKKELPTLAENVVAACTEMDEKDAKDKDHSLKPETLSIPEEEGNISEGTFIDSNCAKAGDDKAQVTEDEAPTVENDSKQATSTLEIKQKGIGECSPELGTEKEDEAQLPVVVDLETDRSQKDEAVEPTVDADKSSNTNENDTIEEIGQEKEKKTEDKVLDTTETTLDKLEESTDLDSREEVKETEESDKNALKSTEAVSSDPPANKSEELSSASQPSKELESKSGEDAQNAKIIGIPEKSSEAIASPVEEPGFKKTLKDELRSKSGEDVKCPEIIRNPEEAVASLVEEAKSNENSKKEHSKSGEDVISLEIICIPEETTEAIASLVKEQRSKETSKETEQILEKEDVCDTKDSHVEIEGLPKSSKSDLEISEKGGEDNTKAALNKDAKEVISAAEEEEKFSETEGTSNSDKSALEKPGEGDKSARVSDKEVPVGADAKEASLKGKQAEEASTTEEETKSLAEEKLLKSPPVLEENKEKPETQEIEENETEQQPDLPSAENISTQPPDEAKTIDDKDTPPSTADEATEQVVFNEGSNLREKLTTKVSELMKTIDTSSLQGLTSDDDESLLVIDTAHKDDNENEDIDMDTETEQTAATASNTDSSSDGSLEIFYHKECSNYDCNHGSKNFYRAPLFTLSYYKVSKKQYKAQFVCEDCYDQALHAYEEMCVVLKQKQPLYGASFKRQEIVEIIDSSDEEDTDSNADTCKDENTFPKESIEFLENELEGIIRNVMQNVDIQNQLSWTKQVLQQNLDRVREESSYVSEQLQQLQKKADKMHNSLYQCPSIKIRQLTPLDLNSGRSYSPESESTIPAIGDIERPSIQLNETYYAVKNKAIASWVPCKVIEEVEDCTSQTKNLKHFKIKFLKSKYPMLKTLSAKHMAYFDPPRVRLPIGTRVIAYFDASSLSRGKEKMLIPSAFYPGIIAEPLKMSNKFRYLVFYDDGYFQYVSYKDVRLVCHASENVWDDVHHQSRDFIQNYLTQYAVNRPMVQTQKGQCMLVDYNGKWVYARVVDVDCSLVQMMFEGQSRSEWIYRGSTRLGPVYKESNNIAPKTSWNQSRISRRTEPFIRYFNDEDSSSQPHTQSQQHQSKSGEVRSVAKKSVSRTDTASSSQPVPVVKHLNNSTIFVEDDNKPKGKVVYYTARKNLPPRDYVPHICSPSCPFVIPHNLQLYSPLAKPLLSGWERQVFRQKSKKFIVYRGPCGKRLRTMDELHRYLRVTNNELNVDNFDFSSETNCLAEYVIESCIVQKKDISNGEEKMPIPCVNYYDNTMPPDCKYSSRRIPTEGVHLNLDPNFLVGCDCEDDCSDKTKCSCWQLTYAGAKYSMPNMPNEIVGYQYKRLYAHVPTGIYECNSRCKCQANCVNRVVQQSLQSKLQVFKTSNRGWGLRCINDVPRGSFICIYAGHLLTEQKANEGGLDAGDEYFAELDYIEVAEQIKEGYESDVVEADEEEEMYNPDKDDDDDEFIVPGDPYRNKSISTRLSTRRSTKNSSDAEHDSQERQVISFEPNKSQERPSSATERPTMRRLFGKDEGTYIMDAKVTGNLGRYFNHSCSPNLFVQNVFVDTHDLRFPWVAFFAFTHIRAGSELTWNYNYEVGVVPGKVLYCQCGAPNCRQRLL